MWRRRESNPLTHIIAGLGSRWGGGAGVGLASAGQDWHVTLVLEHAAHVAAEGCLADFSIERCLNPTSSVDGHLLLVRAAPLGIRPDLLRKWRGQSVLRQALRLVE